MKSDHHSAPLSCIKWFRVFFSFLFIFEAFVFFFLLETNTESFVRFNFVTPGNIIFWNIDKESDEWWLQGWMCRYRFFFFFCRQKVINFDTDTAAVTEVSLKIKEFMRRFVCTLFISNYIFDPSADPVVSITPWPLTWLMFTSWIHTIT